MAHRRLAKALWHPPPHYERMAQLGFLPVGHLTFTCRSETIDTHVSQVGVDVRSSGRVIVRAKTVRREFAEIYRGYIGA